MLCNHLAWLITITMPSSFTCQSKLTLHVPVRVIVHLLLVYNILHPKIILVLYMQTVWAVIKRNAEYKPLQFLAFAFVYRLFEKLKSFEPPVSPTFTVSRISFHSLLEIGTSHIINPTESSIDHDTS